MDIETYLDKAQLESDSTFQLKKVENSPDWQLDGITSLQTIISIIYTNGRLLCGTRMGNICVFYQEKEMKDEILALTPHQDNGHITNFLELPPEFKLLLAGSNAGMLYDVNLIGDQQSVSGILDLEKPICKLSYTSNQPKQVVICVCHELSIKLLNL